MPVKIDTDVRQVLEQSRIEGRRLYLPAGQLERRLYERTNKVLDALGGKWNRKERCHLFDRDVSAALAQGLDDGKVTSRQQDLQFFPTPPALAHQLVALADIQPGHRVCEPSAGTGNIASVIRELHPDAPLDCIELDNDNVLVLRGQGIEVQQGDFLEARGQWDRIVANPPFSKGQDVEHILHMHECLAADGQLVSVAGAGVQFRTDKRTQQLRDLVEELDGDIQDLPAGTFHEAGTDVRTCIVRLGKPRVSA